MHLIYPPKSSKDTGLGNTLFQIATLYSLSKEYGFKISLFELDLYCNLLNNFGFDHKNVFFKKFFQNYDTIKNENNLIIKEGECYIVEQFLDNNFLKNINENINNNIIIEGYFQSHLYFDKYKLDLYDLFEIDNISLNYIQHKYPLLFDTNIVPISIHIRMNYADCINYNFNYFEKAIQYFQNKFNNTHFFVFSNNIDSVKDWFHNKCPHTFITNNIDYIDLWIMSLCKHNIITHSTFAWWGAYLNKNINKNVIFPMDTLKISMGNLYNNYVFEKRKTEYYMKNWIGIENCDTLYKYQ